MIYPNKYLQVLWSWLASFLGQYFSNLYIKNCHLYIGKLLDVSNKYIASSYFCFMSLGIYWLIMRKFDQELENLYYLITKLDFNISKDYGFTGINSLVKKGC